MAELDGMSALVTGGGRGIGKAIALKLAGSGCSVAVADIRADNARAVAGEIEASGKKALAVEADISKAESVEAMVKRTIDAFGRIGILVNNAGVTRDALLMRMDEADWDAVISINLRGAFLCSRAVIRSMMKERRGKIVNIASVVGVMGNAGQANYAASKAGLIGLTKSLAKEVASRNIQVNAVAPGFIESDMTAGLPQEVKDAYLAGIPARRFGGVGDVANAVAFLVSPDADYITGQVLRVDGGLVTA